MARDDPLTRKQLRERLDAVLNACSRDELTGLIHGLAGDLPPAARAGFVQRVAGLAARDDAGSEPPEDLLSAIEEMLGALARAAALSEPDEAVWDDDDEDLGPFEGLLSPLEALFARADDAFDSGDSGLAAAAYERLFTAFTYEDDFGRGLTPWEFDSMVLRERCARWLRALYESAREGRRADALLSGFTRVDERVAFSGFERPRSLVTVQDVMEIREYEPPGWSRCLRKVVEALDADLSKAADYRLREATRLLEGAAGLQQLAERSGSERPGAWLSWIEALIDETAGDEAVIEAASTALEQLPPGYRYRTQAADHGAAAARRLDDEQRLGEFVWQGFCGEPTLSRFLSFTEHAMRRQDWAALVKEAGRYAGQVVMRDPDAADDEAARALSVHADRRIEPMARALVGDWDGARAIADQHRALGWSRESSPQAVVATLAVVYLAGGDPECLPPAVDSLWQWHTTPSIFALGYLDDENVDSPSTGQSAGVIREAFACNPLPARERRRLLEWCREIARRRAEAIVSNKYRKAYPRAAAVAAACEEAAHACGESDAVAGLIVGLLEQFPRHYAFKRALDEWQR